MTFPEPFLYLDNDLSVFFFLIGLGILNSSLHTCKVGSLPLESQPQPIILYIGVSWTVCPGWPWTIMLPFSAFQVARSTGKNHWHLTDFEFLDVSLFSFSIMHWHSLAFLTKTYLEGLLL
jgi:hypothetical protein